MNYKIYLEIISTFKKKEKAKRRCKVHKKGDHR